MDGQCNTTIAGFAIDSKCGEIPITENEALDFHINFIDKLAELLGQSKQPKITVSLFDSEDVPSLGVTIIPVDISELSQVGTKKTFLFRLKLVTDETVTLRAYTKLFALTKICLSIITHIQRAKNLTISTRMSIINSNEITLTLQVQKTTT
jgi:hypothetical protein